MVFYNLYHTECSPAELNHFSPTRTGRLNPLQEAAPRHNQAPLNDPSTEQNPHFRKTLTFKWQLKEKINLNLILLIFTVKDNLHTE